MMPFVVYLADTKVILGIWTGHVVYNGRDSFELMINKEPVHVTFNSSHPAERVSVCTIMFRWKEIVIGPRMLASYVLDISQDHWNLLLEYQPQNCIHWPHEARQE